MANATASNYGPEVEEAAQRIRELTEKMIEVSKKTGLTWLEAYEKVLESMLKLEEQAATGSHLDWVNTLATTHADFVRETSRVSLRTLRDQMATP